MANSNKGVPMAPARATQLASGRLQNAKKQILEECPAYDAYERDNGTNRWEHKCEGCRFRAYRDVDGSCTRLTILRRLTLAIKLCTELDSDFKRWDKEL